MYELGPTIDERFHAEPPLAAAAPSRLDPSRFYRVLSPLWEEHCVECAVPECYGVCPYYRERWGDRCARFQYGIAPNRAFAGLYDFGADIRFLPWAKLEAAFRDGLTLYSGGYGTAEPQVATRTTVPREICEALAATDELLIECVAPADSGRLLLEYFVENPAGREVRFRQSFDVAPGRNLFRVPTAQLNLDAEELNGFLFLMPETPDQRFVFTWLELVQYGPKGQQTQPDADADADASPQADAPACQPAPKLKCVAWDLDNTLWDGILVEDPEAPQRVRPEAVALIEALDARGVLQTIVSKNDYRTAWKAVESTKLGDYFLYPAINWGQKSENLRHIAKRLNIGIDTFALIDDSPFERAEVGAALPEVRIYPETDIPTLAARPELDHPVTETSRRRRSMYQAQVEREEVRAGFSGDYRAFLASCGMRMRLFEPREEAHVLRCWELIQRSNQLNLSGQRYPRDAFDALLADPDIPCVAFRCRDRFGDYGIVGFASIDERGDWPLVKDLVISCRVAQKRIEQTFLGWLFGRAAGHGHDALFARLFRSGKNFPILQALLDTGFEVVSTGEEFSLLKRSLVGLEPADEPVELIVEREG